MIGYHLVETSPAFSRFRRALGERKTVHAYLIAGEKGVGKRTFARAAAAMLLSGHAMDDCPVCRRVREGIHPDLHLVTNQGKVISIEQIRTLIASCSIGALEGQWKCCIIEQADKMSVAAQNSLLKILEEPPADTVFFLTAESVRSVLPTIVSRCQVLSMPPCLPEAIEKELTDKYTLSPADAAVYARYSGGIMAKAEQFVGQNDYPQAREAVMTGLRGILKGELLPAVSSWGGFKGREELLFDALCAWMRDILCVQAGKDDLIVNIDQIAILREQASALSPSKADRMLACCIEAENRLTRNTSLNSIVDALVLELSR